MLDQRLRLFSKAPQEFFHRIKWPFVLRRPVKPLLEVRDAKISCAKELEIQNSVQSISLTEKHQEGGWALT